MLPKNRRIKKSDFTELIRSGRSFYSPNMILRAILTSDQTMYSQMAVVVPKKVVAKAVTRNFLKRRLKYALIKAYPRLKTGFRLAFWLKKDLSDQKYSIFEAEVFELLQQARLVKN